MVLLLSLVKLLISSAIILLPNLRLFWRPSQVWCPSASPMWDMSTRSKTHYFQTLNSLDLRGMFDTFLFKVVLSDSPTKNACLALVVFSLSQTTELAYCKCGDETWKPVVCGDFNAQDVIYSESEDLFYIVNQLGDVAYFSTVDNIQIIKNVDTIEGDVKYLVKSKEELLLVARYVEDKTEGFYQCYETNGFRVYKFHEAGKGRVQWDIVTDVGNLMVFIGNSLSLGLLTTDFVGCKGNCIYFADDHAQRGEISEAGVYDLSNGHIEALPCCPVDIGAFVRHGRLLFGSLLILHLFKLLEST